MAMVTTDKTGDLSHAANCSAKSTTVATSNATSTAP